jgi:hypothetical protein
MLLDHEIVKSHLLRLAHQPEAVLPEVTPRPIEWVSKIHREADLHVRSPCVLFVTVALAVQLEARSVGCVRVF